MQEVFEIFFNSGRGFESEFVDYEGTREGVLVKIKELVKTDRFKGREGIAKCLKEPGEPSDDIICIIRPNGTLNMF